MEIEFEGTAAKNFLKALDKNFKNIAKSDNVYGNLLASIVYRDVIEHFKDESGETSKWEKWSDSYDAAMKKRGKGGNKILQDSGRLRNAFKPSNYKSISGGFFWFNNAKTKNDFAYAKGHDEGYGKLPKRQFMWLSAKAIRSIGDQTLKYLLIVLILIAPLSCWHYATSVLTNLIVMMSTSFGV